MRAGADPRSVVPYRGSTNKNRRLIFYSPDVWILRTDLKSVRSCGRENRKQKLSGRQIRTYLHFQLTKDQKDGEAIKGSERDPEAPSDSDRDVFICVTRSQLWVIQIKSSAERASEHKGLLATQRRTQPAISGSCYGNQWDLSLWLRAGTSLTLSEETLGWLIVVVELRAF